VAEYALTSRPNLFGTPDLVNDIIPKNSSTQRKRLPAAAVVGIRARGLACLREHRH